VSLKEDQRGSSSVSKQNKMKTSFKEVPQVLLLYDNYCSFINEISPKVKLKIKNSKMKRLLKFNHLN
jgi:hypothetical protein